MNKNKIFEDFLQKKLEEISNSCLKNDVKRTSQEKIINHSVSLGKIQILAEIFGFFKKNC